jgi:nucleotide-binding universal stress UspA family protein
MNMKILLAIDDSKFSEAAIQTVLAQPKPRETEVRVLHVVEPPGPLIAGEMTAYVPDFSADLAAETARAQTLVGRAAEALRAKNMKVSSAVEQGDPKAEIIDAASEWHADLIVLGSHGRRGLERLLMGSVSETVARHSPCSVEIVRIPMAH